MKREDFKEILPVHIENCKKILDDGKDCNEVECKECPFSAANSANEKSCNESEYRRYLSDCKSEKESTVVKNAKEFIKLFEKVFESEKTLGEEIKKDVEKTVQAICEATPGRVKTVEDNVNQPNHYKLDGLDVEVLDIIKAVLTKEQFEGFLHGNVIKYTLRTNKKNGVEDLEKAHKYLGWLIDSRKE